MNLPTILGIFCDPLPEARYLGVDPLVIHRSQSVWSCCERDHSILTRPVDPGTLLSPGNDPNLDCSLLTTSAFPPQPQRTARVSLTAVPTSQDIWQRAEVRPVQSDDLPLLVQSVEAGGETDHLQLLQDGPDHPGRADLGLGVEGLVAVPVVGRAQQHLGTTLGGEERQLGPHPLPWDDKLRTILIKS